jgi:hypothetical protein
LCVSLLASLAACCTSCCSWSGVASLLCAVKSSSVLYVVSDMRR